MRPIVIIVSVLMLAGTANAMECQSSAPISNRTHWAWRLIDNKTCWYAGEPGMEKSKLHWSAYAHRAPKPAQRTALQPAPRTMPEPAQRTTPEPAERNALQPASRTQPTIPSSAEARPWSTFGIGLAVPASDIDWTARWPSANVKSFPVSIPAGSDDVETESRAPPRDHALASGAALIGTLIVVLATLYTLAAWAFPSGKYLPTWCSRRIAHAPPDAPKLQPGQIEPQPRASSQYSLPSPLYVARSARRRRTIEEIMAWP
jgi:hypothetical protein